MEIEYVARRGGWVPNSEHFCGRRFLIINLWCTLAMVVRGVFKQDLNLVNFFFRTAFEASRVWSSVSANGEQEPAQWNVCERDLAKLSSANFYEQVVAVPSPHRKTNGEKMTTRIFRTRDLNTNEPIRRMSYLNFKSEYNFESRDNLLAHRNRKSLKAFKWNLIISVAYSPPFAVHPARPLAGLFPCAQNHQMKIKMTRKKRNMKRNVSILTPYITTGASRSPSRSCRVDL